MRKLAITALAAAALFAQGVRADEAAKERKEAVDATKKEMKQDAREAKGEVKQEAREAKGEVKQEAREAQQSAGSAAQKTRTAAAGGSEEKKHPLFDGKDNFEVKGKVQKVSDSSITLQRDELPPATLMISKNTKIELDGEQASAKQLKPGQDVQASFNLQGQRPEAVEIKAEKKSQ
jgi:hypothetical protein